MPIQPGGTAPYAPPKAILAVITRQRDVGLSTPVTGSSLVRIGVSESLTKRTLQALRLLDFIDDSGALTPEFEDLRKVPEPEYKPRLAELLRSAYADVLSVVDPSGADAGAVTDAFRTLVPPGQRDRMVTLFLALLEYTGMWPDLPRARATSSESGAPRLPSPRTAPRQPARSGQVQRVTQLPPPVVPAHGHSQTVQLKSGGSITLGLDVNLLVLSKPDRAFVDSLIDAVQAYSSKAKELPPGTGAGQSDEVGAS